MQLIKSNHQKHDKFFILFEFDKTIEINILIYCSVLCACSIDRFRLFSSTNLLKTLLEALINCALWMYNIFFINKLADRDIFVSKTDLSFS